MNKEQSILKYIPQRPPFIMVDELQSVSKCGLVSSFKIKSSNCLVINGVFQESGLVENMAQTAAMYAGYIAQQANRTAPVGYIGAIKNLIIKSLPIKNEEISTSILLKSKIMNVQIVEANVSNQENKMIAECELRIFLKQE